MEKSVVFYESWQMECCGTPFTIGDTIKWLAYEAECLNTPVDIGKIDYCYEAHSSEWNNLFVIEGKVEEIKILYQKYLPSENNTQLLVPADGRLVKTQSAKGFEKEMDDMEASGYIVLLGEYFVRPAEKEEVTFR